MDQLLLTALLAISAWGQAAAPSAQAPSQTSPTTAAQSAGVPNDEENARKAKALVEQGIQALGGQAYLTVRDLQQEGRSYSFHHGQPTSSGVLFWRFVEYPDKERIEVTKQRDVAYVWMGDKGYEITYKGPHPVEKKELEDYLRRRKFSLETVLRTWVTDPSVAFFFEGNALAGNQPAQQVTLINSKNEAVSLYFDTETHLPIKKSFSWRDVDKQRNLEEEIYANYRPVQGVMTPYDFSRFFNGDMITQRFVNAGKYNEGLNEAMFDPNSGYNPNKPSGKH